MQSSCKRNAISGFASAVLGLLFLLSCGAPKGINAEANDTQSKNEPPPKPLPQKDNDVNPDDNHSEEKAQRGPGHCYYEGRKGDFERLKPKPFGLRWRCAVSASTLSALAGLDPGGPRKCGRIGLV